MVDKLKQDINSLKKDIEILSSALNDINDLGKKSLDRVHENSIDLQIVSLIYFILEKEIPEDIKIGAVDINVLKALQNILNSNYSELELLKKNRNELISKYTEEYNTGKENYEKNYRILNNKQTLLNKKQTELSKLIQSDIIKNNRNKNVPIPGKSNM
jgi:peptidoglycan hydrolase CwlO-like protein